MRRRDEDGEGRGQQKGTVGAGGEDIFILGFEARSPMDVVVVMRRATDGRLERGRVAFTPAPALD